MSSRAILGAPSPRSDASIPHKDGSEERSAPTSTDSTSSQHRPRQSSPRRFAVLHPVTVHARRAALETRQRHAFAHSSALAAVPTGPEVHLPKRIRRIVPIHRAHMREIDAVQWLAQPVGPHLTFVLETFRALHGQRAWSGGE